MCIRHFSSLTKYCNDCALFHAFAGFEPFLAGCFLQDGVIIQRGDYSMCIYSGCCEYGAGISCEDETAVVTQWGGRSERNSNDRLTSTKLQFNSFALSRQSVHISLNFRMSPFVDT